jgi:hypothetical protein
VRVVVRMTFWVMMLCRLIGRYQRFSETMVSTYKSTLRQNTHLPSWGQYVPLKRLYIPTSPHCIITSVAHRIWGTRDNRISGAPLIKKTCTNLLVDNKY